MGDKPQIHSHLVFELGVIKGEGKEAGISHFMTFLNHNFGSQDAKGLCVSGLVVHDPGVCYLILPWRNNLSLYINDVIDNSNFSSLTLGDKCLVCTG